MIDPEHRTPATLDTLPRSLAIAGAWGYIGRKFLDAALAHGLQTYVYDPGPPPGDVDLGRLIRVTDEQAFYHLDVELFHLAVHPEHRRVEWLLARREPLRILNEKPMAEPERPERCQALIEAVDTSPALLLFDFPELFDSLTSRLLDFLAGFRCVQLTEFFVQRSKDREDPANPRNGKRMVPIQYQETVHCLAFVLYVLAAVRGGVAEVLDGGIRLRGQAEPYAPPNPEAYPYVVDGRCRYQAVLGDVRVDGLTDFKRHAPWAKRRVVRGVGDGTPFEVELSYLEGHKGLCLNGREQPCDPAANSYAQVLATAMRWARQMDRGRLMTGLFPNPRFTRVTYQLSSALWRSCRDDKEIAFASARDLDGWDAGFAPAPHARYAL